MHWPFCITHIVSIRYYSTGRTRARWQAILFTALCVSVMCWFSPYLSVCLCVCRCRNFYYLVRSYYRRVVQWELHTTITRTSRSSIQWILYLNMRIYFYLPLTRRDYCPRGGLASRFSLGWHLAFSAGAYAVPYHGHFQFSMSCASDHVHCFPYYFLVFHPNPIISHSNSHLSHALLVPR